jgi:RsiW-degrading membrane proteinase PrsW (M82 family)
MIPFVATRVSHDGIGPMSTGLMEPVSILANFLTDASLGLGGMFVLLAILRYRQYRRNPLEWPLSSVVMMALFGIVLLVWPLVRYITINNLGS